MEKKPKKQKVSKKEENNNGLNLYQQKQIKLETITCVFLGVLLIFNVLFTTGILPLKESPDSTAFEIISRKGYNELYQLTIHNRGKIAHNLRVEISFPINTTLISRFNYGGKLSNESFEVGSREYDVEYSEIQEEEIITIRLVLKNDDFNEDETLIIEPNEVNIWNVEEGIIEINYSYIISQ